MKKGIFVVRAENALRSSFLVLLAVFFTAGMYAQEYRGRIQGTVLDASQAPIVGATVTLVNVDTNVPASKQTNETGHYLFDLVEPGNYMLTVQSQGFNKFQQQNILLPQRGDVTVDATLKPGDVLETVEVSASGAQVQFNTSKLETAVDSRIVGSLPQFFRDPFLLSKVDPTVVTLDTYVEQRPFNSRGTPSQSIGGMGQGSMDLQVDGAPIGLGAYAGYIPSPDMVQEVNVQVNAVDAEFGHSTGSAISVSLKSGTNQFHGVTYYQGLYPWMNAISNRVTRTINVGRNHFFGGTLGHPIKRNKWFNFVSFEGWQMTDPQALTGELPTALERQGDFSQSLNGSGALRMIYDPWTTYTSPDGATVRRTPFPNNTIPGPMISRVAAAYTAALPQGNSPGIGNYHQNNYVVPQPQYYPYRNFSDRTDYIISDTLRYTGRVSLFRTPSTVSNPAGNDLAFMSDRGSDRDATQITNDITWTKSATTVISGSFAYYGYVDASHPRGPYDWATLWPNNKWYDPIFNTGVLYMASPGIRITMANGANILTASNSNGLGTNGYYWIKHPWQDDTNLKVSHERRTHYLKAGFESRASRVWQVSQTQWQYFTFNAAGTANTYVNPNTAVSGDGYASFLLGAIADASMPARVRTTIAYRTFATYLNDDWRIGHRLTLNLGLRWEYEQPYREEQNRLARGLDLTVPIPALQGANAPQMPPIVKQYYSGQWTFNGAYQWTEDSHRGQWNAGPGYLSPRVGLALRLTDKTAIRVGWGHYITPWVTNSNITQGNFYGFQKETTGQPWLLGVPQMHLDNPFPPSSYPVQSVTGKTLGTYTGLGDSLSYFAADRPRQRLDRFNFSVQRQIPLGMVVDVTYYLNLSNDVGSRNINQVDPRIGYTYKAATNVTVANPFYNLLPATQMPGPLRNQKTVSLNSLMVPYPQYGSISVTDWEANGGSRFHQGSVKVQKRYSHRLSFMGGYAYTNQASLSYYDSVATYLQQRTWQKSTNPRHRVSLAAYWEMPLGHGRAFLPAAPRVIDAAIGGWNVSPILTWHSGAFMSFGGLLVSGDPHVSNPGPQLWFDTTAFKQLPAYTQRTNPLLYSGITGPGWFNLDLSLVKSFRLTEKFSAELRADVFNAPNSMTWNDPSTGVTSTFFGKSSDQLNANGVGVGRQTQLGLRIRF